VAPADRSRGKDCKRQVASIYVWVQLTSGEHRHAPRPIEAGQHLAQVSAVAAIASGLARMSVNPHPEGDAACLAAVVAVSFAVLKVLVPVTCSAVVVGIVLSSLPLLRAGRPVTGPPARESVTAG
jgi:hypothetical protein